MRNLIDRFTDKVVVLPNGCWEWQAKVSNGYAYFRYRGASRPAHIAAYELYVGPVPDGLELDHLCHSLDSVCLGGKGCPHRRCVNPAHLEPVTPQENRRRARRSVRGAPPSVTECKHGHPFDVENTYFYKNGHRACRACARAYQRRLSQRRRMSGA